MGYKDYNGLICSKQQIMCKISLESEYVSKDSVIISLSTLITQYTNTVNQIKIQTFDC